jgi:tetratricopeptide (TPR) repeat protein
MGYLFQMIRNLQIKRHITRLVIAVVLILVIADIAIAKTYGYQKQDIVKEKKRYLEKLSTDKKKVELAVSNTKNLINRSKNKSYLPELYLRLAELYVEQSRIEYFLRKSERNGSKSPFDQLASHTLKTKAIEIYKRILNSFPDYEARDKVLFFMAHEFRELGRIDEMIVQYRSIIKKHPKSTYVPEAYLLLGDHFINLQDLETAKKHYLRVLTYPDSPAVSIARYKLAWCHINRAEFKKAIKLFEDAIKVSVDGKKLEVDTYKRVDIKMESLVDMAYCYTECYKKKSPREAMDYFEKYAWSRQVYVIVLEKLAYRYFIKKKWHHASEIYRRLSTLQHDTAKLLEYARNIFECNQALGTFKHADIDIAAIIKALQMQKYSVHIADKEKQKTLKDYEMYARNMVTHLHEQARKNKSVEDFRLASESYELYLDFFDESPVAREMASNYAESLFSSNQFLKSGEQYEKLSSDIMNEKKEKEEKLYGAILSYYNALKQKDSLNHYQKAFSKDGLITTGKKYVSEFPESSRVPDVLFNVAWITYDAGEYDNAIKEFTRFVKAYPNGKASNAAIHMVLDSYNLKEDFEGLVTFGRNVIGNKNIKDKKLKREVAGIIKASESKIISSLTLAAIDDWDKGKSDLINYASKRKSSGMGEKALKALIISSKEKGDLQTLMSAGSDFIQNHQGSSDMEEILNVMINSSVKASQYRYVVDHLELFSKKFPKHADTPEFLYKAGMIRKRLGQYSLSNTDFQSALRVPKRNISEKEDMVLRISENAFFMGKTDEAIKILITNRRHLSGINRIMADAIIADLSLASGKNRQAATYRKKAYTAYTSLNQKSNSRLNETIAKMSFNYVQRLNKKYMSLQLKDKIDNNTVTEKAKLLERLESSYQSIMKYKSPEWALMSCYRLSEINGEFARFLKESPVPDLTPEQKKQYINLINKKADGYNEKAYQYIQTCIRQARKWEICDPQLAGYYNQPPKAGKPKKYAPFSGSASFVEIQSQSLQESGLRNLHEHLMQHPDDFTSLLALAQKYIERSDYRHAILILDKAIEKNNVKNSHKKAELYNALGISCLYTGDDRQAQDAFKNAIDADENHLGAKMNLAGLMQYYGHKEKADKIYKNILEKEIREKGSYLIHPRARELYYAYNDSSKK